MTPVQRRWKRFSLILTVGRLVVGPLFFLFYAFHQEMGLLFSAMPFILLALVTLSELSDFFDGFLARKFHVVTDLGKVLDPMCDSVTKSIILLTFTLPPVNLPVALIFIFVIRDGIIGVLRAICALKGVALAARPSGKAKAIIQTTAIYIVIICMAWHFLGGISLLMLQLIAVYTVVCSALITLLSAVEYLTANWKHVKSASHIKPTTHK